MLSRVRSGNLVRDRRFLEWNEHLYSYLSKIDTIDTRGRLAYVPRKDQI